MLIINIKSMVRLSLDFNFISLKHTWISQPAHPAMAAEMGEFFFTFTSCYNILAKLLKTAAKSEFETSSAPHLSGKLSGKAKYLTKFFSTFFLGN